MNDGETILLVDDTPANLDLLRAVLSGQGYRVSAFPGGEPAIEAALKQPPDLIMLDVLMPEMDGYEVCERMKSEPTLADVPVVFISALGETLDKMRAFAAGGVDYVTKPFRGEEVLARIRVHLENRRLQRMLREQNANMEELVAKRTRELAAAHVRVLEMDRLKDDFLRMISHELRTPASGILGIGELILRQMPDTEPMRKLATMFRQSSHRMRALIEDATLIVDVPNLLHKGKLDPTLSMLLMSTLGTHPSVRIEMGEGVDSDQVVFPGSVDLWERALGTLVELASHFVEQDDPVHLKGNVDGDWFDLHIVLPKLDVTHEQAEQYFNIDADCRAFSNAQAMGLAPVVAFKIITAFGGMIRLAKDDAISGHIAARIPVKKRKPG
jgi:two-component system, sensor histidine kinase and response regulator